jgi:hypothetical protein
MTDVEQLLSDQGAARRALAIVPDREWTVAAAKYVERKYDDGRPLAELYRMAAELAQILDAAATDWELEAGDAHA